MENRKRRNVENKESQINLSTSALANVGIVGLIPVDGSGLYQQRG